jgi:hypothetical protein
MQRRTFGLIPLSLVVACSPTPQQVTDPIADVPLAQQRVITRAALDWRWPFRPGVGTLGCTAGAVLFRAGGVTYGLNGAARNKGTADPAPIRLGDHSAQPSDPVSRLTQEARMQIFGEAESCGRDPAAATRSTCEKRLAERSQVSDAELARIEVEGHERAWSPLPARLIPLDAVVAAGAALCPHR